MPIPEFWKDFISRYKHDNTYWFFPKASTVDTEEFRQRFRIFDLFEGDVWNSELQTIVLKELREEKLSNAGLAYPRMLKRVFEVMGLCSVELEEPIAITNTGRQFLQENGINSDVLDGAIWRYQLPNPLNQSDATKSISLHPHAFLVDVLLKTSSEISADEYCLFISRAKDILDVERVVSEIQAWRELYDVERADIKSQLRDSIYPTIVQNRSYAFAFHNCDLDLQKGAGNIFIPSGNFAKVERRLADFRKRAPLYKFSTDQGYINFLASEPERKTPEEELDYYIDISDVENAVRAFAKLPSEFKKGKTEKEFREQQLLEKDLEDFLELNMDLIEPGLRLIERQYQTRTGPLDLLGVAENGDLVVVELKKDRASDKVFGQISRYIGGLIEELEKEDIGIRGYIVCRSIDERLVLASKVARKDVLLLRTFSARYVDGVVDWVEII